MKESSVLYLVAVILLVLNLADVVSTWVVISNGKGYEANPVLHILGGPFSPAALFLKLFIVPFALVGMAWWVGHRANGAKAGLLTIIPATVVYGAAVANNIIVAAKKVKKNALERKPGTQIPSSEKV